MKQQTLHIFNSKSKSIEKVDVFYSDKYLKCGNENCVVCSAGKGHGPYWHASFSLSGQVKKIYLGKKFSPQKVEDEIRDLLDITLPEKPFEQTNPLNQKTKSPKISLPMEKNSKSNLIDRIDLSKIPNKAKHLNAFQSSPPNRSDFEKDLILLGKIRHPTALKTIYKKLIKKYHPDKFPGHGYMNGWMAEINGLYQENAAPKRSMA